MSGASNPSDVSSRKQQAWKLFSEGQTEKAHSIGHQLITSGFADAETTYLVGCCQARMGRLSQAVDAFNQSIGYKADLPYTHIALGAAYNAMGKRERAVECYRKALSIKNDLPEAYHVLGDIFRSEGRFELAESNYSSLIRLHPDSSLPYYKMALLEKERGDTDKVIEYVKQAVEREPDKIEYLKLLGESYVNAESYDDACEVLTRLLDQDPLNKLALGSISIAFMRKGDYDAAMKHIDHAVDNNLLIANVAVAFLSVCKHVGLCDKAVEYAESCLDQDNLADHAKDNIYGQLALTLDIAGQFDKAWHYLTLSKQNRSRPSVYDPVMHSAFINDLMSTFSSAAMFQLPKASYVPDCKPIFIVGMPRSGTSLVETILSTHTEVTGGGELVWIGELINQLPALTAKGRGWPQCILDVDQHILNSMATDYSSRIEQISRGKHFVTDKMPHNFYALGLIQLMFPDARIIHCRRNVYDTCISVYFQNFLVGHEYSDNLFNLGTHYHQYERLMQHWRSNLSIDMFEIDYEQLVSEPETYVRALLEYCDLPWDEACLAFDKKKRRVKTASFDQVRQPIHNRSVERWRNYEKYLGDLFTGLDRGL